MIVIVAGLLLTGCSYSPARLGFPPLVEISGHPVGHDRHHGQDDQGEDDNAQ